MELERGNLYSVKSLGQSRLGGYGILWGNEEEKDLYEEFFTPRTQELLTVFKSIGRIPALYNHGMDAAMRSNVTGYIDIMQPDDKGVWVEEQLKVSDSYLDDILYLVKTNRLFWSSGALPAAYEVNKSGQILRWPVMEMSKTTTPAEWRMAFSPISQLARHYKSIGVDLNDLPSDLTSSNLTGLSLPDLSSTGEENSHEDMKGWDENRTRNFLLSLELMELEMEDVT